MNLRSTLFIIPSILITLIFMPSCFMALVERTRTVELSQKNEDNAHKMIVYIIVGSTRTTHTGLRIAENINTMLNHRSDINTEIIDIASYNLPFYTDPIAPADRKEEITDPLFKNWSDKIKQADGYIIVSPVYNYGYPAPLKNALDCLYKEWNNKPVAFVGYSGGPSGGAPMIAQLRQVVQDGLKMIPVAADVKIPYSWKAFDGQGNLKNAEVIEKELETVVDQLVAIHINKLKK